MLVLILVLTGDSCLITKNFWDFSLFGYTDYTVLILVMVFCLALGLFKIFTYFKTNSYILTIIAIITYMCIKSSQVAYYEDSQEKFMIGVLVLLGLLYGYAGQTNFYEIVDLLGTENVFSVKLGGLLIITSLLFKIGAAPFHLWLPNGLEQHMGIYPSKEDSLNHTSLRKPMENGEFEPVRDGKLKKNAEITLSKKPFFNNNQFKNNYFKEHRGRYHSKEEFFTNMGIELLIISIVSMSQSNTYVNGLETTIFESHAEFSNLFSKLNKLKDFFVLVLLMYILSHYWVTVKNGKTLSFLQPECVVPTSTFVAGFDYVYELLEEKPLYKKNSYKLYKDHSYKEYVATYSSIRTPGAKNSPEFDCLQLYFVEFSGLHAPLKLASRFLKSEIDWFKDREKDLGNFVRLPHDIRVSFKQAICYYFEWSMLTESVWRYPRRPYPQLWQYKPWPKILKVFSYSEFFEAIITDFHDQIYCYRHGNAGDVIDSISLQIKKASRKENPDFLRLLYLISALWLRPDPRCLPVFYHNQKNWSLEKDMPRIWQLCYDDVNQLILWFLYLTNGIKLFPCLSDDNQDKRLKSPLFYRCTHNLTPNNSKESEPVVAQKENHFFLDVAYIALEIYNRFCKNEKTAENILCFKFFLAGFGNFISYFQIPEQELISALFPEMPKSYKKGFSDFYFKFNKIFFDAKAIENYFKNWRSSSK